MINIACMKPNGQLTFVTWQVFVAFFACCFGRKREGGGGQPVAAVLIPTCATGTVLIQNIHSIAVNIFDIFLTCRVLGPLLTNQLTGPSPIHRCFHPCVGYVRGYHRLNIRSCERAGSNKKQNYGLVGLGNRLVRVFLGRGGVQGSGFTGTRVCAGSCLQCVDCFS